MTEHKKVQQEYVEWRFVPPWLKFGPKNDLWISHMERIRELIGKYGLKAADVDALPYREELELLEHEAAMSSPHGKVLKRRRFPGGMLVPHFHYGGEVYLVPDEKWQEISMNFKNSFMDKLEKANSLRFDQVMALSETVDLM
jgi:hypothetical protein